MTETVLGSKMPTFASEQMQKSNRGWGQNGDPTPSSLTPKQAKAVSETLTKVSPPQVIVPTDGPVIAGVSASQTRPVTADQVVATHPGLTGAPRAAFPGKSQSPRPSSVHGAAPRTNAGPINAN